MTRVPMLTILVPTFNRAEYLRECLTSLLATSIDCEVLVADNASADHTESVVQSFADSRIRYHRHPENIGYLRNFNYLFGAARGKYICFFGDDDAAMPGCFEPKIALLESHPHIDLVYSMATGMDANGRPVALTGNLLGRVGNGYVGGRDEFQELLITCYIQWQTMVFRRTALEEVGDLQDGWGLTASHDWYWLQRLVRGRQTAFIQDRTVRIRFHVGSYSHSEANAKGLFGSDRLEIWRRWLLQDPNPPFVSEWMWDRMAFCIEMDVRDAFGENPALLAASHEAFQEIKRAYRASKNEAVRAAIRLGDPYQTGLEPWPLDGVRGHAFYFAPRWENQAWHVVLTAYMRAFTATDDVTLVLNLDPSQGVSPEQVGTYIDALIAESGLQTVPDMMLVTDALTDADFARLYAAVAVVVAPGDHVAAVRARRMGRAVLYGLAPSDWQDALQ